MYKNFIKRIIDLIISLVCLCLFSPILIFLIIGLTIANSGSPFFIQKRPGKNGKIFSIIKFKTMTDVKDNSGNLLSDAERITKIGGLVRKLSLDEIPQLINVISGEMSLIGPRPLLPEYLPLYSKEQYRRHNVKPGITGWAQVNGRNAIEWKKKLALDTWYVDNLSLLLDIKIIILTIKKVIGAKDISASNHATIEKFNGQN